MKKLFIRFCLTTLIAVSFLFSQNSSRLDSTEEVFDQTSDDIERLVDDIVQRVESGVERLVEGRSSVSSDLPDDEQDQEKKRNVESNDAVTFNGDTEIAENDTVQGDIVVKNGALTIRGMVNGDVLVVNGSITVKSTGHVKGNARAMNGSIVKEEGAVVEGYTEQSSGASSKRKRTYRTRYSYSFKPDRWLEGPFVDDNFLFRYNRVEGWFFGFGSEKKFYWDGSKIISGHGSFGYGFASHKWRLQLGLDRQFATPGGTLYEIGAEAHSFTDTKDEWLMKLGENNLAAIFFREDYRDYFQREGFSMHSARYTKNGDVSTMIDLRFSNDRYTSLPNQTNWSVFGGNKVFRTNPLVNEGIMKSVSVTAGISTVEKYRSRSEGWDAYGRAEYGGNELGGDFDFTQTIIDVRRFQPFSDDDQLSVRFRVGSLEGTPIIQKTFELGGTNTMPAYAFKEFAGNRMALGNLEYQVHGEVIDELLFWPSSLNVILFGDAGAVTTVSPNYAVYEGFERFTTASIKSDVGFAIGWHDGGARFGFAWRTDKSAPVAVFFRLNRAF